MRKIIPMGEFLRDVRKVERRGKKIAKLYYLAECLAKGERLAIKHRPHPLKGDWKPKWECHIEPDWLLVYEVTETSVKLIRTGTHSDLF
ncbi:MAG: type II toxin-antitoxin system YafQ family toxin [Pseudomonadota bacterium]